jgi:hypothetical protein
MLQLQDCYFKCAVNYTSVKNKEKEKITSHLCFYMWPRARVETLNGTATKRSIMKRKRHLT